MAAECRRLAPELSWPSVARRYDDLAHLAAARLGGRDVIAPLPSFDHIVAMSDERRHVRARRARRSRGSVTATAPTTWPGCWSLPPRAATRPPPHRSGAARLPVPRRRPGRRRHGAQPARRRRPLARPTRRRGLLGPGDVGLRHGDAPGTGGLDAPGRRVGVRTRPRAALAVAAGDGLRRARRRRGAHRRSRGTSARAAAGRCRREPSADLARSTGWPWPEARLTLRQRRARRGADRRRRPARPPRGARRRTGRCCVGCSPGRPSAVTCRPPVSAAPARAITCRCSTSSRSRPPRWPTPAPAPTRSPATRRGATALILSVDWFLGANDAGAMVCDPEHGAGFDGLDADGVNLNQGAESTLALITTLQHARAVAVAPMTSAAFVARSPVGSAARPGTRHRPAVRPRPRLSPVSPRGERRASSPTSSTSATPR